MRKLTALEKWSYAIGNIPYAVKDTAFGTFVVFYYTQVLGLSGTLSGLAMLIALSWDAVSDPIVGSWSDRVRSRWGRRHLLMAVGSVPTAILFLFLFNPPAGLSEFQVFLWLVLVSVLLRTFLTLYFIPYQAMGAEMSDDYDERTALATARVTVAWLGGMALPAIAYALIFQPEGGTDGRLIDGNYWYYGIMSTVLALITGLICLWGTRSTIAFLPQPEGTPETFSISQPFRDLLTALNNENFRRTIGTKLGFGICAGTYVAMGLYIGTYFWEFSADQLAGLVIPTFLATITAFAVLKRVGQRWDKPRLISAICMAFTVNAGWFIGARLLGLLPDNGHFIIYPLQALHTYISVFLIIGLQVLGASLLADILDEQQLKTGLRQEGVFFAASAFVLKATTGVGSFVAGVIIDLSGLPPGAEPGTVADFTLLVMGLCVGGGMSAMGLLAWFAATKVRLSRDKLARIRLQLSEQVAAG
jgi:GPH family glycoside/pentoside/hexuronide:cation symporter